MSYVVAEALRQCGFPFELHAATDGEMALSLLHMFDADDRRPSLVLLDLNLPKVSGAEVLEQIRGNARYQRIPVIITTSSDAPADVGAVSERGATAYFRKPTNLEKYLDLRPVIRTILAQ